MDSNFQVATNPTYMSRAYVESDHQRLIDVPYIGSYYGEDGDFHYGPGYENYRSRQLYLQSYKFKTEESLCDKLRACICRFKAAVWVVAFDYRPALARKVKYKLKSTTYSLKAAAAPLVLTLPNCVRPLKHKLKSTTLSLKAAAAPLALTLPDCVRVSS